MKAAILTAVRIVGAVWIILGAARLGWHLYRDPVSTLVSVVAAAVLTVAAVVAIEVTYLRRRRRLR